MKYLPGSFIHHFERSHVRDPPCVCHGLAIPLLLGHFSCLVPFDCYSRHKTGEATQKCSTSATTGGDNPRWALKKDQYDGEIFQAIRTF